MTPIKDDCDDKKQDDEFDRFTDSGLNDFDRVTHASKFPQSIPGMDSDVMMREFQAYCGEAMNLSQTVIQNPNNNVAVNALQHAYQRCLQFSQKYMGSLPPQYQNMIQQSLNSVQYGAPSYAPAPTNRYMAPPTPSQGSISRSPSSPRSSGGGSTCRSTPGYTCSTK